MRKLKLLIFILLIVSVFSCSERTENSGSHTSQKSLNSAEACDFKVNSTKDTVDANPGDGVCADIKGRCTLRAAIMEANEQESKKVICLESGKTYILSLDLKSGDDNNATEDDLDIAADITIEGNKSTILRDPNLICDLNSVQNIGCFRIFHVLNSNAKLTLKNVVIENGDVGDRYNYNASGGGILNNGTLIIQNTTILKNHAGDGGGISNSGILTVDNSVISKNNADLGGGIYNQGNMTIRNSTISNNVSKSYGGGIYDFNTNENESVKIINSTIANNYSIGYGGGVFNGSKMSIQNCTISNNSVIGDGGGIYNQGDMIITNSNILKNSATESSDIDESDNSFAGNGGGICNHNILTIMNSTISENNSQFGGGIHNVRDLTIINSTISNNNAYYGGGISNTHTRYTVATVNAAFISVVNNSAVYEGSGISNVGEFNIKNSIIARNTMTLEKRSENCNKEANLTLFGINFTDDATCTGFNRVNFEQLKLQPLGNYGGMTPIHALSANSVAIDAVSDCTDLNNRQVTTDQRGVKRPQGVKCDAGAYEYDGVTRR